jgi:uncharacterized MAPEG superfamily protein
MTTDLMMLVAAALFSIASAVPYTAGRFFGWSYQWVAGNRDSPAQDRPWMARAERAHRNLLESLPAFAALVLIAHVTGRANDATALGSVLFVGARLAYAPVYILGIIWVRTACWLAAVAGMVVIATQLL